jgi:hypothetical protein
MTLIEKFLAVVAAYRAEKKVSTSRLSFLVFGDGKVLGGLTDGRRDITTRRLEAALSWFSKNWPERAVWPDGVARPECSDKRPPSLIGESHEHEQRSRA